MFKHNEKIVQGERLFVDDGVNTKMKEFCVGFIEYRNALQEYRKNCPFPFWFERGAMSKKAYDKFKKEQESIK